MVGSWSISSQLTASMDSGGNGLFVGDGMGVRVDVDAGMGVGAGVETGLSNLPMPQPHVTRLANTTTIAIVRCFLFILSSGCDVRTWQLLHVTCITFPGFNVPDQVFDDLFAALWEAED
jgi:hypothetical protein